MLSARSILSPRTKTNKIKDAILNGVSTIVMMALGLFLLGQITKNLFRRNYE